MIPCSIINGVCRMMYGGEYRRFMSVRDIKDVQFGYLTALLKKNSGTEYGRRFGFADMDSYERFADKVPLTAYSDYEPYIADIACGKKNVLTSEDVLLFEPTSGSTSAKKLIPYTPSLKAEFQHGIKPWLYDIYTNVRGVTGGKSYWSITPVTEGKAYTDAGIPIGFEEDAAYFGRLEQLLMDRIFAVGGSVKFSVSMEEFWHRTALALLKCGSLTLISVWSPTFLTLLCEHICGGFEQLKKDISPKRADMVYRALCDDRFDRVFPDLRIISCWADGSAAAGAEAVRKLFPSVYLQPKGLLATEYFASFPLVGEEGGRLCVTSHFFEFMRLSDGDIVTADKLTEGEHELIVTTGGGFYRYMTGDVIDVLETYPDMPPRIRFLRRSGITCDLCGEKLTDDLVRMTCEKLGIADRFCLLAPENGGYVLYTSADNITGAGFDAALRESYHYDYCRSLGQLGSVRVKRVGDDAHEKYLSRLTAEGMRLGDIKPAYLSAESGWDSYFYGE